jgi:hypothetical protein
VQPVTNTRRSFQYGLRDKVTRSMPVIHKKQSLLTVPADDKDRAALIIAQFWGCTTRL